jgi:hypothetical protein
LRLLNYSRSNLACFVLLLVVLSCPAWASTPVLTQIAPFPSEGQPDQPYTFHLTYTSASGDRPTALEMVIETPGGPATASPSSTEGTDPAGGIVVTWTLTPKNVGTYRYHFEATSATGESTRYPIAPSQELEFASYSLTTKYIILVVGILIALMLLPVVIYSGTRAVNKRGDPAAAARMGLFVGVLASYALFWYLFAGIYQTLGLVIGGVAAAGILVAVFAKR